ncbi:hypothetical protein SMGD1_2096 [Sulfurimonas gotlandica GD1]|uniref:Uncharacterized protein n=1 Tax=Sulfurimonas gotlandica (strain DSM 19862 / JCM 16533 / GD1) TaxID=929558 RepID=B6BJA0_SULGG|nr:hypothetical protein [Sulfurimonas gotlandica]EDZ62874.1 hypothetical protein CBGD1_492 [Sulfurimonas gotlandica GD1]EHP30619.1 hypothetical protein SMGD1_2096 [Sulfurimonas gotlandica GD1]
MELMIENVLNIGEDEFYRASRYKLPLSAILINSDDNKAFDILENNTRQIDIVQQLSSDLLIVFLAHTDHSNSLIFLDKIKNKFDFTYTSSEFIGSQLEFVRKLFLDNRDKGSSY